MPNIPGGPSIIVTKQGALNAAVVRNSFFRSLQRFEEQIRPWMPDFFVKARKSQGAQETYAQVVAVPTWKRWKKGEQRKIDGGKEFYITVPIYEYQSTIQFHKNDRMDDRTGTFQTQINAAARYFISLRNDIGAQLLEGQVNPDLLPSIPNTYYGLSLFSSSHTFAVGGNIVNGSGTSATQVEADIYSVLARFRSMKQENGKPYWNPGEVSVEKLKFVIPNNSALIQAFEQLQKGNILAVSPAANAGAGRSNILVNRINFFIEPRLTDANDWYAFLDVDPAIRPFVEVPRQELDVIALTWPNSDHSAMTGYELYGASTRVGFSVYEPRCIIKVTNA